MTTLIALALAPTLVPAPAQSESLERVEHYLADCESFGWSGVALIAHEDRITLNRGYGDADRSSGRANTPRVVFEIASVTKPITAVAILRLVEDGVLELDGSIADYLPGVPEDKHGITIRHLLSHTSGMPRSAGGGGGDSLAAAVASNLGAEAAAKPGESHAYWNGGYALLAGVVDHMTAGGYLEFCHDQVFDRAKLKATGFTGEDLWSPEDQAIGYANDAPVRRASEHAYGESYGYQYRGMGGVVTSAEELWRLGRAVLDGEILEEETVKEMLTVVHKPYGLGWAITETKRGTKRISHGGDVRGFHATMHFFPDEDTAVILMSNVDEVPMWHLAWNIEALLLGGDPPYPLPPRIEEVKALPRLDGVYSLANGDRITVAAQGRALELRAQGLRASLLLSGAAEDENTRDLVASAVALVEAVAAGDSKPVAEIIGSHIPPSWPGRLVEQYYPAHVAEWGAVQSITPVAVSGQGTPHGACVLALHHEAETTHVRVAFRSGKLAIFDLRATRPRQTWRFAPVIDEDAHADSPQVYRSFTWSPRPAATPDTRAIRFVEDADDVVAMEITLDGGAPIRADREK